MEVRVITAFSLVLAAITMLFVGGCSKAPLAPEVTIQGGLESLPPFEQAKIAAVNGDVEFIKSCVAADPRYIEAYDEHERTLLHYAAGADQVEVAQYLIENGAVVNFDDSEGLLPFDAALQGNASEKMKNLLREAGMREAGIQ